MLKLYQFPRPRNFPNFSPFCVKLETYLKIAKIPYENVFTLDLSKNPKKLMPYIEINGQIIGDSSFIIDKLVELEGDLVDHWLTPQQQAEKIALQRLLENHLMQILVYFRWVYPQGWEQFRTLIFAKAPKLVKIFIGNLLSKKIAKRLKGGNVIGRFGVEEILQRAKTDLDTLSTYLGDNQFILGNTVSSLDALILGIFGGIICIPVETPLKDLANDSKYNNLKEHALRLLNTYYPDISVKV